MANEVIKLAYESANAALREQDQTLGSLRTRATGLLAAAAIGTSFATSVGLYRTGPGAMTLPTWAGWSLLGLVVLVGTCVMVTLWPVSGWKFGVQPEALLDHATLAIDDVYTTATRAMVAAAKANDQTLKYRFNAYRIGAASLILQVITLVIAVQVI